MEEVEVMCHPTNLIIMEGYCHQVEGLTTGWGPGREGGGYRGKGKGRRGRERE